MRILCIAFVIALCGGERSGFAAKPARLVVRSIPEGATISVDGRPVGRAEVEYGIEPGRHRVTAELPDHEISHRDVIVAPGETQVVSMFLLREEASSRAYPVLKWTTFGIAIAAIGTGITLLAIGDDARFDGQGLREPEAHDQTTLGGILVGAGAGFAGLSAYLFYLDGVESKPAMRARWTGAGAVLEGTF